MKPYYEDELVTLYLGDWKEIDGLVEPTLVVTDPPYGETNLEWDKWPTGWPKALGDRFPGLKQLWCFGSTRMFLDQRDDFEGWRLAQDVVWSKPRGRSTDTDRFSRSHELVLHWYRGPWGETYREPPRVATTGERDRHGRRARLGSANDGTRVKPIVGAAAYVDDGSRLLTTVMDSGWASTVNNLHPTQKPVDLIEPLVRYSCAPDGLVFDPFAGSGSILVAARNLGRRAAGVEVNEQYCETAARRLSQQAFSFEEMDDA